MIIRMSDKKRWFSKIYSDSQESKTDTDISWSSSDSDQENTKEPPKKKKVKITEILQHQSKKWMNEINVDKTPPPKKNSMRLPLHPLPLSPTDEFLTSPIISQFKLEDQSPILTQNEVCYYKEPSPVICRSKAVRKIKWHWHHRRKDKVETIEDESSDSCQSVLIIENPVTQTEEESPTKSVKIDPFPSQHGTEIVSSSFSSLSDPKSSVGYQLSAPSRKKRLKKGTLSSQLQKALDLQSSSSAIWQHEMFLNQTEEQSSNVSDCAGVDFCIINEWEEYGCKILQCKCVNGDKIKNVFSDYSHLEFQNYETFLVIVNIVSALNSFFQVKDCYRMYLPYSVKIVPYKMKRTLCVIDLSRCISL